MDKIFVGGVSPEGEQLLRSYLEKFMPDAILEPLSDRGIIGKMKNHAVRPDVALVIIDDELIQKCRGVADGVLALPKVHHYTTDDGLKEFLISKFGSLDSISASEEPTGLLLGNVYDEDDVYIPHQDSSQDTVSPTPIVLGNVDSDLVEELRSKLAESEAKIQSLTIQLEASSDGADDEVVSLRTRLSQSEMLVRSLTMQVADKDDDDVSDLVARIRELETELANARNDACDSEISNAQIESLNAEIEQLNIEKERLEVNNNDLSIRVSELQTQVIELGALREDVRRKSEELERLHGVSDELVECKEEIHSLYSQLAEKDEQIEIMKSDDALIIELQDQIKVSEERIEELESSIESKVEEIKTLNSSVQMLKHKEAEADTLREDVKDKRTRIVNLTADNTRLTNEVNSLTEVNKQLESTLEEERASKTDLESKVSELNDSLIQLNSDNAIKTEEVETLSNKVIALQQQLVSVEINPERLSELEDIIAEKDSIIEGLKSQLEMTADVGNEVIIAELNSEISNLRNQLSEMPALREEISQLRQELSETEKDLADTEAELVSKTSNVSNVDSAELKNLRSRCTQLELELAEKDIELNKKAKGVFSRLQDLASPKLAMSASLPVNITLPENFTCIASGSDESTSALYKTLRHTCLTDTTKRILIIDLAYDSSIDREFGCSMIASPVDWLTGMKPFTDFISSTKYANVKVMSTSMAYLNDLFFLQVDWSSRLSELQGVADAIVINIGDINSVIVKVLFNTFSKLMKTYVIAKSTPINLRSVFLNLSGLKPLNPNVLIECVDYDSNASKQMYQKLSVEYNTQILKNNEILKL